MRLKFNIEIVQTLNFQSKTYKLVQETVGRSQINIQMYGNKSFTVIFLNTSMIQIVILSLVKALSIIMVFNF